MSALGFSFIKDNDSGNIEPTRKHSRTLRKRNKKTVSKIDNLISSLSVTQMKPDDEEDDGLAEFTPLSTNYAPTQGPKQVAQGYDQERGDHSLAQGSSPDPVQGPSQRSSYGTRDMAGMPDEAVTTENFAQLSEITQDEYYKQYVPNYDQMRGSENNIHTNRDGLMKKLNYMVHLLEEQQDEKTDNVMEELVLYLFLGVFVIFIVDSFARAGKYTR